MKSFLALLLLAVPAFAADPVRVACVGDSITHGVGAGTGGAWPDQLDRMLDSKFDVRGFGHSGATVGKADKHSYWTQKEYKNALGFRPDVVVLMLGTNDTKPENWKDKKDFPKLYRELIESFTRLPSAPKVFCCTPPFVPGKGNFGINEPVVLEMIPIIQEVAKATGASVVDVHGATADQPKLFPDNVHPNLDGATLIAKTVYASVAGKKFEGSVPGLLESRKDKPAIISVENPGAMTYREVFAAIMAELTLTTEERAALKAKFDETAPVLEATLLDLHGRAEVADGVRMKYKHATDKEGQQLSGDAKKSVDRFRKNADALKTKAVAELVALIPAGQQGAWGAAVLHKFISDKLASVAITITGEQRAQLRAFCAKHGPAFAKISNDYERATTREDVFKEAVEKVLTPEQKKRV